MTYLLDTNVWVQYLRGRDLIVAQRLSTKPTQDVRSCSVVGAELSYGVLRSSRPDANRAALDKLLRPYSSLPFDDAAADEHASIHFFLQSKGTPIGLHDMQIAAIALVHGCVVVTHNTGEFDRVPGLTVEDWETP